MDRTIQKFDTDAYEFVQQTRNMSPHCLVKCRIHSPDRTYSVADPKVDVFEAGCYVLHVSYLQCQTSNIRTLTNSSDRMLHDGTLFYALFTIDQSQNPIRYGGA